MNTWAAVQLVSSVCETAPNIVLRGLAGRESAGVQLASEALQGSHDKPGLVEVVRAIARKSRALRQVMLEWVERGTLFASQLVSPLAPECLDVKEFLLHRASSGDYSSLLDVGTLAGTDADCHAFLTDLASRGDSYAIKALGHLAGDDPVVRDLLGRQAELGNETAIVELSRHAADDSTLARLIRLAEGGSHKAIEAMTAIKELAPLHPVCRDFILGRVTRGGHGRDAWQLATTDEGMRLALVDLCQRDGRVLTTALNNHSYLVKIAIEHGSPELLASVLHLAREGNRNASDFAFGVAESQPEALNYLTSAASSGDPDAVKSLIRHRSLSPQLVSTLLRFVDLEDRFTRNRVWELAFEHADARRLLETAIREDPDRTLRTLDSLCYGTDGESPLDGIITGVLRPYNWPFVRAVLRGREWEEFKGLRHWRYFPLAERGGGEGELGLSAITDLLFDAADKSATLRQLLLKLFRTDDVQFLVPIDAALRRERVEFDHPDWTLTLMLAPPVRARVFCAVIERLSRTRPVVRRALLAKARKGDRECIWLLCTPEYWGVGKGVVTGLARKGNGHAILGLCNLAHDLPDAREALVELGRGESSAVVTTLVRLASKGYGVATDTLADLAAGAERPPGLTFLIDRARNYDNGAVAVLERLAAVAPHVTGVLAELAASGIGQAIISLVSLAERSPDARQRLVALIVNAVRDDRWISGAYWADYVYGHCEAHFRDDDIEYLLNQLFVIEASNNPLYYLYERLISRLRETDSEGLLGARKDGGGRGTGQSD